MKVTARSGPKITLTATADKGSKFVKWNTGPCAGSTSTECSFVLDQDRNVDAQFNKKPWWIRAPAYERRSMTKLFCSEGLSSVVKIALNAAGMFTAINNPTLAASVLPAALALKDKVDGGTDNTVLNGLLKQGLTELVPLLTKDPVTALEVNLVLSALDISVEDGKFPTLDNKVIQELVDGFISGVQAGINVKK